MTGRERRWLNPDRGPLKLLERNLDIIVSRFLYPRLSRVWNPYAWLLARRFGLTDVTVAPPRWPPGPALRVLLLSDIHTGIFLRPDVLGGIVTTLMQERPDLVVVADDHVTGHSRELAPFLPALAPLAAAPLGAWACMGNHDYFGGNPEHIRQGLDGIGVRVLRNETVRLTRGSQGLVLGGIDDLIMGRPDWPALTAAHGAPHLLIAHNPDHFYAAATRRVPLILSGHTHGGQIRFPSGPPIIRQSRFCLDEGVYAYESSVLVVSRGLGSVGLPWRWGADPEALLIEVSA
jgi:hypothetical protein